MLFARKKKKPLTTETFCKECEYIARVLQAQIHPVWMLRGIFESKDAELDAIAEELNNLAARISKLTEDCQ